MIAERPIKPHDWVIIIAKDRAEWNQRGRVLSVSPKLLVDFSEFAPHHDQAEFELSEVLCVINFYPE